jgi:hypothetical protein
MKPGTVLTIEYWVEEQFEPRVRHRKAIARRKANGHELPNWKPEVSVPLPLVQPPFAPETDSCPPAD